MPKDLSLLRPFNLQKALNGETVCTLNGVTFTLEFNNLKMAPLCWIEDKPVYKDDVLYIKDINMTDIVIGINPEQDDYLSFKYTGDCYKDNRNNNLSWTKPKQKKQGWINVYPKERSYWYPTKEKADKMAGVERIACVPFEYEE